MRSLFEPGRVPESTQFKLNAAQQRAIEHGDGPLLVIAGAGTGKTRVITERIRNLFERDDGLLGENVLALTYTTKAAGEMLRRIKKACGERADGITVNTFHGFCEAILKEGAPQRKPIAPVDHWILLRRNMFTQPNFCSFIARQGSVLAAARGSRIPTAAPSHLM